MAVLTEGTEIWSTLLSEPHKLPYGRCESGSLGRVRRARRPGAMFCREAAGRETTERPVTTKCGSPMSAPGVNAFVLFSVGTRFGSPPPFALSLFLGL